MPADKTSGFISFNLRKVRTLACHNAAIRRASNQALSRCDQKEGPGSHLQGRKMNIRFRILGSRLSISKNLNFCRPDGCACVRQHYERFLYMLTSRNWSRLPRCAPSKVCPSQDNVSFSSLPMLTPKRGWTK